MAAAFLHKSNSSTFFSLVAITKLNAEGLNVIAVPKCNKPSMQSFNGAGALLL